MAAAGATMTGGNRITSGEITAGIRMTITAIVMITAATSLMTIADTARTGSIADFSRPLPQSGEGEKRAQNGSLSLWGEG
ncbi:hypothetical protein D3C81_2242320 [compost metagenome]